LIAYFDGLAATRRILDLAEAVDQVDPLRWLEDVRELLRRRGSGGVHGAVADVDVVAWLGSPASTSQRTLRWIPAAW
jgi:hypothetical protein